MISNRTKNLISVFFAAHPPEQCRSRDDGRSTASVHATTANIHVRRADYRGHAPVLAVSKRQPLIDQTWQIFRSRRRFTTATSRAFNIWIVANTRQIPVKSRVARLHALVQSCLVYSSRRSEWTSTVH